MHATPMSTINHKNNVLVLLLVHRGAVKADRKWRCNQIYSHFEGLYCILVKISGNKNYRKFSGNFWKDWNKLTEEISRLTTLVSTTKLVLCLRKLHHRKQCRLTQWDAWCYLLSIRTEVCATKYYPPSAVLLEVVCFKWIEKRVIDLVLLNKH